MSKFDHIKAVEGTPNRSAFFYYVYPHGTEKTLELTGFDDTRELFDFIKEFRVFSACGIKLEVVTLGGEWEVDDEGNTYDFDAEIEIDPEDDFDDFMTAVEDMLDDQQAFRESWREEIAREEGMLHGVDAYNDWMGW